MKYIKIFEKLSINNDVEILTNEIYEFLKDKSIGKYTFKNSKSNLKIKEIIIDIFDDERNSNGAIMIKESFPDKNGNWTIIMNLRVNPTIYTIQHECNHILQLIKNKSGLHSKLNYIKSGNLFKKKKDEMLTFFDAIYLASDHEIESIINESYAYLKETLKTINIEKLNNEQFNALIKEMRGYKVAKYLIEFDLDDVFKDMSEEDINKFFILFSENKAILDSEINKKTSIFSKAKEFYDAFAFIFFNKKFKIDDDIKIKVRSKRYYQNYINSQGEKLRRKILKLYDHFT